MSSTHIQPFHFRQKMSELGFECFEHLFEVEARRFAEGMEMKTFDSVWERGETIGIDAES